MAEEAVVASSPDEAGRQVDELFALLIHAVTGDGHREGPSTDIRVMARRLVESGRVHLDIPGRLTIAQVAALARRCGDAETALREERLRRALDVADVERLTTELAAEAARVYVLEGVLDRVAVLHGQALAPILAEVARG